MNQTAEMIALRAAWVIPIDRPPIRNGVVTVMNKKILSVAPGNRNEHLGNTHPQKSWIDLGDAILAPAWVNAHTHLEFSDLPQPLGKPGMEFTDWIRTVVAHRRNQQSDRPRKQESTAQRSVARDVMLRGDTGVDFNSTKQFAIAAGLRESMDYGVGLIGEIATQPYQPTDYPSWSASTSGVPACDPSASIDTDIRGIIFLEQLGRDSNDYEKFVKELGRFLQPTRFANRATWNDLNHSIHQDFLFFSGLSPHAPYSVPTDLAEIIVQLANRHQRPVAMHLAETESERELLASKTGSMVEMLKDFGVWDRSSFRVGDSIEAYLQILAMASRSLVVHGNYLNEQEMETIAEHRERMSVVFCPRTHRFFGHRAYPLEALLKLGVCVALGTDSKASNPDLNLFEELKEVRHRFAFLAPEQILEMGTINGARALGLHENYGSLTPGKQASFSVITGSQGLVKDWRALFDVTTVSTRLGEKKVSGLNGTVNSEVPS